MPVSALPTTALLAAEPGQELTGLSGLVSDVVARLGEVGVFILTLVETVFPPVPSEVILPLAGYLAERGRMNWALVLAAATLGSVLGALVLYALGARLGRERSARMLAKLPLVDAEDVAKADDWFDRHGKGAVFFGRLVPGVRSLISIPAGAQHMPVLKFTALTLAGSLMWNALLVGAGMLLGTQYKLVDKFAGVLDYALIGSIVLLVGFLAVRRLRANRQPAS